MKSQALMCLSSLAEHGSYVGAAQALTMSPTEVSVAVHALEEEMGVVLVSRVGRGVRLTRAGDVIRSQLPRYLQSMARLREQAQAAGRRLLRVVVSEGVSPPEVSARLQAPLTDGSEPLDFTIKRMMLIRQRVGLARGEFDVGLSQVTARQQDQGLEVEVAWREPLVALLPEDHPRALRETLCPSMLDVSRLFVLEGGYAEQIADLLRGHVRVELEPHATPGEVMLAMQAENGSIGLMGARQWPAESQTRGRRAKSLVSRPVVDAQTGQPLWLTTYLRRPVREEPGLAQAMAELMRRLQNTMQPSPVRLKPGGNDYILRGSASGRMP